MRHAISLLLLIACATAASAQHLGSRLQWQPQTENDPRLQQPVEIEIIGRAAVTGLPILSEKTGVSLSVAPEDLATVGERKFTVIAKGLDLKTVMVQLCEALQECHWDVDSTGQRPVYLLHRNASVEEAVQERITAALGDRSEERRTRLVTRTEEARAALRMTGEGLTELVKTDPVLALTVRNADARAAMEAFLSLPAAQRQRFLNSGELLMRYADAPPAVQQAAVWGLRVRIAEQKRQRLSHRPEDGGNPEGMLINERALERKLERIDEMILEYRESTGYAGPGVRLILYPADDERRSDYVKLFAIPPRYPVGGLDLLPLLVAPGAGRIEREWEAWGDEGRRLYVSEQARIAAAQALPESAETRKALSFNQEWLQLCEFQAATAHETTLSIISDYFTEEIGRHINPGEEMTIRDWVSFLGKSHRLSCKQVGPCLVWSHLDWHNLATAEIPEQLLTACREKLIAQGCLTLDDLVALATALQARPQPRYQPPIPSDLADTGVPEAAMPYTRWAFLLYDSLSPSQLRSAGSEGGLAYDDMTPRQRELVRKVLSHDPSLLFEGGPRSIPADIAGQAVFRIRQLDTETGQEKIELALSDGSLGERVSLVLGDRAAD